MPEEDKRDLPELLFPKEAELSNLVLEAPAEDGEGVPALRSYRLLFSRGRGYSTGDQTRQVMGDGWADEAS